LLRLTGKAGRAWAKEKTPQQTTHDKVLQMLFENSPAVCQNKE
jgi:hypothetical protein